MLRRARRCVKNPHVSTVITGATKEEQARRADAPACLALRACPMHAFAMQPQLAHMDTLIM